MEEVVLVRGEKWKQSAEVQAALFTMKGDSATGSGQAQALSKKMKPRGSGENNVIRRTKQMGGGVDTRIGQVLV